MSAPPLFDPGLQPERTELSWRRTALAIGVGSLGALKVLPDLLGSVVWVAPGLVGLAVAFILWIVARRRSKIYHEVLVDHRDGPLPGGGLLALAGAFSLLCGVAALVFALYAATR